MKIIFLLFLFVVGCAPETTAFNNQKIESWQKSEIQQRPETEQTNEVSDAEYQLYSELWCSADKNIVRVISNETVLEKLLGTRGKSGFLGEIKKYYATANLTDVSSELAKNYNFKNDKPYPLKRNPDICTNYNLVSNTEISSFFKDRKTDGWTAFYKKYPSSGGYMSVSRIGLSPDKKQAVFYVSQSCGWLCGSGIFYFYVNENGKWVKKLEDMIWVS